MFTENALSAARVSRNTQYFPPGFKRQYSLLKGNYCIFYLLQNATKYERPVRALWLSTKGDAKNHINDLMLYMDQLKDLRWEEKKLLLTIPWLHHWPLFCSSSSKLEWQKLMSKFRQETFKAHLEEKTEETKVHPVNGTSKNHRVHKPAFTDTVLTPVDSTANISLIGRGFTISQELHNQFVEPSYTLPTSELDCTSNRRLKRQSFIVIRVYMALQHFWDYSIK